MRFLLFQIGDKMTEYYGLQINLERDELLEDYSRSMLMEFYSLPYESSPQHLFARASLAWSTFKGVRDYELAQRLYDAVSQKWFMFASPVLSNAPSLETGESSGMPISCFLTYVPDSVQGLIDHSSELRWLSVMGGGVGGAWNDVRTVSDKAPGPIPFLTTVDADMTAYKQGKTRKGSYAAYIDVDHPDILEFINLRVPTGDSNRKTLNLHNAVNITDSFMHEVLTNGQIKLKCPSRGLTGETINARKLWQTILETRARTGEPYLNFIDTANKGMDESLKRKGLKINGSNLCNEIHLPTDDNRTAVCCLSSLNLEYYEHWKDTTIVEDLTTMLDNVLEFFIENAPQSLGRAVYSAKHERSIGLGAMGFHALLQSKGLAFGSMNAKKLNGDVFKKIKNRAKSQSSKMGIERGCFLDNDQNSARNSHLLAIAPNASSGIILATSPSIEPYKANAYTHKTRLGSFLVKNKYLEEVLEKHNKNDKETWSTIVTSKGSVQHLDFLSAKEKEVFKTAIELDQQNIVDQSAIRQKYVCQGQSVNLFFEAGADRAYVNKIHIEAWRQGLKGLYYYRTESKASAENVSTKVESDKLQSTIIYGKDSCPYCKRAKALLEAHDIDYRYIDLNKTGQTAAEATGLDVKTVPQIYLDGNYIEGGYTGLEKLLMQSPVQELDECRACEG